MSQMLAGIHVKRLHCANSNSSMARTYLDSFSSIHLMLKGFSCLCFAGIVIGLGLVEPRVRRSSSVCTICTLPPQTRTIYKFIAPTSETHPQNQRGQDALLDPRLPLIHAMPPSQQFRRRTQYPDESALAGVLPRDAAQGRQDDHYVPSWRPGVRREW